MFERITNGYNAAKGWFTWGVQAAQNPQAAAQESAADKVAGAAADAAKPLADAAKSIVDDAQKTVDGAVKGATESAKAKSERFYNSFKTTAKANPVITCLLTGTVLGAGVYFAKDNAKVEEICSTIVDFLLNVLDKFITKVTSGFSQNAAGAAR